ncbi:ATPase, partial [Streptomyces rochei]|nr:ATPase [Streptomyces rochei]
RAFAAAGADAVDHVSACLANADLPVEEERLAAALRARGWGTSVEVRNDTFAVLRAGVDEPRGVAVVCGAGVNCV